MNRINVKSSFRVASFTALGLLLISSVLMANHHGGKHQRGPIVIDDVVQRMQAQGSEQFRLADANKDGQISLAEFEQHKPMQNFKGKHNLSRRDHEGEVSQNSQKAHQHKRMRKHLGAMAGLMGAGVKHKEMRAQVEMEMFALLDTDKDGTVSTDEYKAANNRENKQLARKRVMFKMLDTNADGMLASEEMPNPEKRLRALDSNDDGIVDRVEMSQLRAQFRNRKATSPAG